MKAHDFVVKQLDTLLDKCPYLQARYERDAFSASHYVEILPTDVHKKDAAYIHEEQNIISAFIEKYPYETLTFFSDKALFEIENPIYVKKGESFNVKQAVPRKRIAHAVEA